MNYYFTIPTPFGDMLAAIDDNASLTGLWFVGQKHYPSVDTSLIDNYLSTCPSTITHTRTTLTEQLQTYASGTLKGFNVPISLHGTPFQVAVWQLLRSIDYGTTTTYGDLAKKIALQLGKPSMSAQAIGQAVGRNPIALVIPCHRVLGSNGKLTGYAGGVERKVAFLQLEGSL